jgi:hypothetical protein
MALPTDPERLLTREALAEALTEAGFPISKATLATKASRGGGPAYRKYGPRPLYRWADALGWARSKLGPVVTSTAERTHRAPARSRSREPNRERKRPRRGERDRGRYSGRC